MEMEKEHAVQKEKEDRVREITHIRNEQEGMIQSLNQNFDRQIEKNNKQHDKVVSKLGEEFNKERDAKQKREKELMKMIEELKHEGLTWRDQITQLQTNLAAKDGEIRGMQERVKDAEDKYQKEK